MFPIIARFALVMFAGKALGRITSHPRLAPLTQSRKGKLALMMLGFGMRRHPRTRTVGKVMRTMNRRARAV